jgi:hypothetical protein
MSTKRLVGPYGQLFAEPGPSPDAVSFQQDNTSADYYKSVYFLAHKTQVQPIPEPRIQPPRIDVLKFIPPEVAAIKSAGQINFHSCGDTGAAKVNAAQSAATAIGHQSAVADAMAADVQNGGFGGPAFFFHLGDVVYNFGEDIYYYDQFYEPYRSYDRPIFAIPGNHDGMVFGPGTSAPQVPTLAGFLNNFCASAPGPSPDGGGLIRSVMTQPGAFFTLDAPFVSIIGLYSNVLDGPGVLSSQNNHYPISDEQLTFLQSELTRLKPDRVAAKRAVIIAVHHPPLSADAKHGGSTGVQTDIDNCCKKAGLYPDAVLSGHAHLYQRFTRNIGGKETPYVVCGSGGFAATIPMGGLPAAPVTVGDHTLVATPIVEFGYLSITTDAKTLTITFRTVNGTLTTKRDAVTVDLKSGKLTVGGSPGAVGATVGKPPKGGQNVSVKKTAKKGGGPSGTGMKLRKSLKAVSASGRKTDKKRRAAKGTKK